MTQICSCGQPTAGAWLCDRCIKTFAHAIPNIGIYHADLGTVARRQTRYSDQGGAKGSIGKSQPLPVDLRFVDAGPPPDDDKSGRPRPATIAAGSQLRWDTHQTLRAWCITVHRSRPHDRPAPGVPGMTHYLARHFQWITQQTWAPQMLDELLDLERRLRRFVDRPPDRWYAGQCGALTLDDDKIINCPAELYAEAGRTTITCPACGATHDVAQRREVLLAAARDYLVTATEAAGALMSWTDYDGTERNLIARIGMWRIRGRVESRGTEKINGKDAHLYRLGDLQDKLVAEAQREQERRIRA